MSSQSLVFAYVIGQCIVLTSLLISVMSSCLGNIFRSDISPTAAILASFFENTDCTSALLTCEYYWVMPPICESDRAELYVQQKSCCSIFVVFVVSCCEKINFAFHPNKLLIPYCNSCNNQNLTSLTFSAWKCFPPSRWLSISPFQYHLWVDRSVSK